MRSSLIALGFAAAAIGGALAASLARPPFPVLAEDRPPASALVEVTTLRTNDTGVIVYDADSKHIALYSVTHDNKLRLESARNTTYDLRLHDYRTESEKGYDPRSLKRAVDEQERREKEEAARREREKGEKRP